MIRVSAILASVMLLTVVATAPAVAAPQVPMIDWGATSCIHPGSDQVTFFATWSGGHPGYWGWVAPIDPTSDVIAGGDLVPIAKKTTAASATWSYSYIAGLSHYVKLALVDRRANLLAYSSVKDITTLPVCSW